MVQLIKRPLRPLVYRLLGMASRHRLAGPALQDAINIAIHLQERGYRLTLGYWNAADEDPADIIDACQHAIEQIRENRLASSLSIKAWSFNHDMSLYRRLLDSGRRLAVPLHFDSHLVESVDSIFGLIRDGTPPPRADIGCTLPGRWSRSLDDAGIATALGVNVRVVRGQAADPGHPGMDPARGFLDVVDRLSGGKGRVEVATHDPQLARSALRRLQAAGTPCELQLLYGLPVRQMLPLAREMDVPVRVYVPFGNGWLMFVLSSALSNPKIIFSQLKTLLARDYLMQFPVR